MQRSLYLRVYHLTNVNRCTIDRPPGATSAGRMSIINHFLDLNLSSILIPDNTADAETNSAASIEAQCNICISDYGSTPNFVLVDHAETGQVFQAQDALNNF